MKGGVNNPAPAATTGTESIILVSEVITRATSIEIDESRAPWKTSTMIPAGNSEDF